MPHTLYVNNENESADEQRQLAREEALFLYSNALLRQDFDSVATILGHAEIDPVLEGMILGLSPYLEAECLPEADVSQGDFQCSEAVDYSLPHSAAERCESGSTCDGLTTVSPKQPYEDLRSHRERTQTCASEWRDFVGAASEVTTRLHALYLTAMDHLDRGEYDVAAQCADDAVQMALEVDDIEAAAECLCLYGIIESARANHGTARTLFRIGLMILGKAESGGPHASDDLRVELQTAISRLEDRSRDTGGW